MERECCWVISYDHISQIFIAATMHSPTHHNHTLCKHTDLCQYWGCISIHTCICPTHPCTFLPLHPYSPASLWGGVSPPVLVYVPPMYVPSHPPYTLTCIYVESVLVSIPSIEVTSNTPPPHLTALVLEVFLLLYL